VEGSGGAITQRALAIPMKRCTRTLVGFLSREEVQAIINAPDPTTRSVTSWRETADDDHDELTTCGSPKGTAEGVQRSPSDPAGTEDTGATNTRSTLDRTPLRNEWRSRESLNRSGLREQSSGLEVEHTLVVAILRYRAVVARRRWPSNSGMVQTSVPDSSKMDRESMPQGVLV